MSSDPLLGHVADGLRFMRLLGKGGMGSVYEGFQERMQRPVAIKVIAPHLASDPDYLARFTREAQCLGRLRHEHIIACYDHGTVPGPDGAPLLVMVLEYVPGGSLGERLRDDPAPVRQVLGWFAEAADGLGFAHGQGVLHRDIKPDNLMLTAEGRIKLADFGLARAADQETVTATGSLLGSPAYMAPEACRGEGVTEASDLYSLGCSLFQALTGQPPYLGAGSLQVLQAHQHKPVPDLAGHRDDLADLAPLLTRVLAKKPTDRGTVAEFARVLRAASRRIPLAARSGRSRRVPTHPGAQITILTGVTMPVHPLPNRRWLAVGGGVLALGAFGLAWGLLRPAPPVEPSPTITPASDNVAALLDKVEILLSERRGPAATAALDTLPLWVRDDELTPAQKARIQALRTRIEQGEGLTPAEVSATDRLDRAERQIAAGDVPGAVEALAGMKLSSRLASQEERRLALLARAQTALSTAEGGAATVVRPLDALVEVSLADLPLQAPWTTGGLGMFPLTEGVHRLRLPTASGSGMLIQLGVQEATTVTVLARAGGTLRRILSLSVEHWSVHAIPVIDGSVEDLVLEAGGPVYFAAACTAVGRVPGVAELPVVPGTLVVAPNQRPRTNWAVEPVRALWFEPAAKAVGEATLGRSLATALGLATPVPVDTYQVRERDLPGRIRQSAQSSRMLLFGLPTILPPNERFQDLLRRARTLTDEGILPVIVVGIEQGRLVIGGQEHRAAWQKAIASARDRGGLALIDLGQVPAFYARHQQPLDPQSPAYGAALLQGLDIGLRQLVARIQAPTSGKGSPR